MRARSASSLRSQLADSARTSRRQRRYSASHSRAAPKAHEAMQRAATLFEPIASDLRRYSIGGIADAFGSKFFSSMSNHLDTLLSPGLSTSLDALTTHKKRRSAQKGKAKQLNYQGVQEEENDAQNIGKTGECRCDILASGLCSPGQYAIKQMLAPVSDNLSPMLCSGHRLACYVLVDNAALMLSACSKPCHA